METDEGPDYVVVIHLQENTFLYKIHVGTLASCVLAIVMSL